MIAGIGRKRLVCLMAGALLTLVAAWCYHLYGDLADGDNVRLASVPRLQINDFKPLYDRAVRFEFLPLATSGLGRRGSEDALYIIDVRSQALYSEGHIRGALSIPESELGARITSVVPPSRSNALIVLYCA